MGAATPSRVPITPGTPGSGHGRGHAPPPGCRWPQEPLGSSGTGAATPPRGADRPGTPGERQQGRGHAPRGADRPRHPRGAATPPCHAPGVPIAPGTPGERPRPHATPPGVPIAPGTFREQARARPRPPPGCRWPQAPPGSSGTGAATPPGVPIAQAPPGSGSRGAATPPGLPIAPGTPGERQHGQGYAPRGADHPRHPQGAGTGTATPPPGVPIAPGTPGEQRHGREHAPHGVPIAPGTPGERQQRRGHAPRGADHPRHPRGAGTGAATPSRGADRPRHPRGAGTGAATPPRVAVQAGINSETAMSRGLYQPATSFMGRQMSAVSSIGDFSTEQKSPQPTKNFSIPDPHSHQQTAQNCNVTDSYVVQTNSDTQCLNKSDKIDGKTSPQIGEKMLVTASVLSEEEQTHCLEIGSNTRHGKSNLSEGKNSAELHSPLQERLSPENRTTDLKCDSSRRSEGSEREILTQEHIEVKEERARPPVSPLSVSEYCASENKCSQDKHSAGEVFSDHLPHADPKSQKPFRKMQEEWEEDCLNSSSDLTVSVSEDDLILKSPEPQPNPGDKIEGEDGIEALKLIHSEQEKDAPSTEKHNCILQTLSSPDSEKESSANSPTRQ
ncbi:hypothetical protein QTO34_001848 [Cnephaeus nilssonii]|uniref:Centrosomal protein kizuna n=1 Tax=Cnephaeus nilssonii TaxID=3371016 RepID=A0AA40HTT3_CNENI|nr:hypothetical protein QTO34_001848 [Eptesicus nilssonii]